MNILIPAAGMGKRFRDAGFSDPKPLIRPSNVSTNLLGLSIMSCISSDQDYFYVIAQNDVINQISPSDFDIVDNIKFISIDKITEGAACTALLAKDYINNDESLLIINSDQLINDADWVHRMKKCVERKNADGAIVCFPNNHPKWSYVKINDGVITQVKEKQQISEFATVGAYYWKHGSDFVSSAELMIEKNQRTNNEFYIAPSFNELIIEGKRIIPFFINEFWGLGTPEDLKYFENNFNVKN